MLSHCFACQEPFKYWGQGKIFMLNPDGGREVERFWLCSNCSESYRIHLGTDGRVELASLRPAA